MASKRLTTGTVKQVLISTSNASSGSALGTFNTQHFSSIGGMLSVVGSLSLQARFGVSSASFQVSSVITANSGGSSFSLSNPGLFTNLSVTAASSQLATVLVFGQP